MRATLHRHTASAGGRQRRLSISRVDPTQFAPVTSTDPVTRRTGCKASGSTASKYSNLSVGRSRPLRDPIVPQRRGRSLQSSGHPPGSHRGNRGQRHVIRFRSHFGFQTGRRERRPARFVRKSGEPPRNRTGNPQIKSLAIGHLAGSSLVQNARKFRVCRPTPSSLYRSRPSVWVSVRVSVTTEDRVHLRRCGALQSRHDVAVGIQCEADLAVAQDLHDCPGLDTLSEQERGCGVSQVVEPDRGQPGRAEDLVKLAVHVSRIKWLPVPRGENESAVSPLVTSQEAFLELTDPVRFQRR